MAGRSERKRERRRSCRYSGRLASLRSTTWKPRASGPGGTHPTIETEDLSDSSSGLGIGGRGKPTARERHGGVKKSVVRRGDARASHAASDLLSPGARRRL